MLLYLRSVPVISALASDRIKQSEMASIRIAEVAHTTTGRGDDIGSVGGVFPARSMTPTGRHGIRARTRSLDRRSLRRVDSEAGVDEDAGLRLASDFKKKQVRSCRYAVLSLLCRCVPIHRPSEPMQPPCGLTWENGGN